ncbi:hypothetical protein [Streptomyces mirabilis]|uniref:Right handed beta helix region n=1 Tax=Streptomyces mirabilis TaxID=68239 RepID=A0A1I2S2F5_9ACTN|nr:hypothetical protein [Streptomyces mirabilis]SFG47012.1 hypothetical protein SAMN02787118_12181 [Streptomyces mirabilis]
MAGAVGRVTRSTVGGNDCRQPDPDCGPDFFSEIQHAGIVASTPGTVVRDNRLAGNRIGIYAVGGSDRVGNNHITRSSHFGMALRTSGAPVRTFEWYGFTATATVQP